jgi:hypothetical protein
MAEEQTAKGPEPSASGETPYGAAPSAEEAAEHPPATGPEGTDSTAEGLEERTPDGAGDDA